MKTSIATVCLSGTLRDKLRAAAFAGFDGVEIFEQDLLVSPESPEEIADYAAQLGLTLDLFQPFRDFEGVRQELFEANLQRAEEKFKLMARMGMDMILVCSNVATATVDDDLYAAQQLAALADLAAPYKIKLAYEALAWGKYVNDFEHSWRIVQLANRDNLGICLDSFHILSRHWPIDAISQIPGEKIFFLQLADAPAMSMGILEWSRHHRLFPGEGNFDLVGFLHAVLQAGYTGPLSLEIFNDSFRQTNVYRTAVDAHRCLTWLSDQTAASLTATGLPDTENPLAQARLPQAEVPRKIGWVEIRGAATEYLQTVLSHLGFSRRGDHRSKPLQLWEQGSARLVINEENFTAQQPHLASLAFVVENEPAAVARCKALKVPELPRITGDNEQRLSAFTAPDDTEIFFLPPAQQGGDQWVEEFSLPHPHQFSADSDEQLITGIDHINLVQPRHYYPESLLFFRAALGLQIQGQTSVAAPDGLVSSQVVNSPSGSVKIPLNITPELRKEAVTEHIAFSCSDVAATARRAKKSGLHFLPIPPNYYDDLRARFGLSQEFIDSLAELDLLYDQDEHGEFLHFYTLTSGSVFFEVVERRGGYRGFGASNAPVRMASQHQLFNSLSLPTTKN